MKKRGFTLIELLAVIVILAIIALIATPIILNIINKAKKSAFLDSAYGIVESARLYYTESVLDGNNTDKTFLFEEENELKYSGSKPKGGVLTLSRTGEIALAIYNNSYCASKGKNESKITITKYEKEKCMIPDSAKDPVIKLKGEEEIKLKVGDTYTEAGVEAKTVDGSSLDYTTVIKKENEIVESIDTSIVGTYIITYTAESNGKTSSIIRRVIIEIQNADTSKANKPVLNGLVPIKWNGTTWIKADENNPEGDNQWYDYNNQMWANGASVTESYRNVAVGSEIPESEILAYFVWIPRYEYMYTNLGDQYAGGSQTEPGEIKVKFISKDTTSPSSNEYKVHPAFTFGEDELSGIWVGKFEPSVAPDSACGTTPNSENCNNEEQIPYIKPNIKSLRHQYPNYQFETAKKFSINEDIYGISSTADSHMMKNSEWGAVAYLSQSKYGKYGNSDYSGQTKQVYINNNADYITGCSSGNTSSNKINQCQYTYEKSLEGTGASTTGTIYGIYDMSGSADERVMGAFEKALTISEWENLPDEKYYNSYHSTDPITACNSEICYGHALSETSEWYLDQCSFITANSMSWWLIRGGSNYIKESAGIFAVNTGAFATSSFASFRVVLIGK